MHPATTIDHDRYPAAEPGRGIIEFARRAPSVHNTQPWAWRIRERSLDLYADRTRQLSVADRDGRMLTISCGAALHYAVAGAAVVGWSAQVVVLPDPADPDHLASLALTPSTGPVPRAFTERADLLTARTTDRRRFIGWPVPSTLLASLAADASHGAASALPMTTTADRIRVELLMSSAAAAERIDPRYVDEQHRWTDRATADGVPLDNAVPVDDAVPVDNAVLAPVDRVDPLWPTRFDEPDAGGRADSGWTRAAHAAHAAHAAYVAHAARAARADGIVVIVTEEDTPAAWLDAGDVLCQLWTAAMEHELSLVPLSQVVEVPEAREVLRLGVVAETGHPALVVRIGWQEISRRALPRTPRRSIEDQLRPDPVPSRTLSQP